MNHEIRILLSIALFLVTCILMILSILLFPEIKIKSISLGTYWIIVLVGAICVVFVSGTELEIICNALIEDSEINPFKILVLFISMTLLSVYIDEMGFFQYMANIILKKSKASQMKLFFYLFLMVSVLTIFTSNDVIILSFTPFICYFASNAKVNPLPYLTSEFVAANTWSMTLIIGNPTNIYLGTANNIDFVTYIKYMIASTVLSGLTALGLLFLMFRSELNLPIIGEPSDFEIKNKVLLIEGVVHLGICVIILAISSYIGIQMWIITLTAVGSLFICVLITSLILKRPPSELGHTLKRAPWELIPFVLGMFIIILVMKNLGVTDSIGEFLGNTFILAKYGALAFLSCNIINNIPMSVLFSAIMEHLPKESILNAVYPTVAASNIGAFFTPIGALAGIMFTTIVKKFGVKFGYLDFLTVGVFVALPTFVVCIISLRLMLWILNKN